MLEVLVLSHIPINRERGRAERERERERLKKKERERERQVLVPSNITKWKGP
jgi:hypothetical protein